MTNATSVESGGVRGDDRAGTSVVTLPPPTHTTQHRRPGCTCRVLRTLAPNRKLRRAGVTRPVELHADNCPHGDDWGGHRSWQYAGKARSPFKAVDRG